jgi:hypothetical protein
MSRRRGLDDLARERALVAEPDGSGNDQDVGGHDETLVDVGELVVVVAVLAHVGPQPRRDVSIHRPDLLNLEAR